MSAYQLYEILKSVEGVTEEQARKAMDGITYADGVVTKEDLRNFESPILTKEYLDARLLECENRMLKWRRIHSGIIIVAISLIIVISEFII